MKNLLLMMSICLVVFSACKKTGPGKPTPAAFDCLSFKTGVAISDNAIVGTQINTLTSDLYPSPIASDEYGQGQNIQTLVQRLSQRCDVTATLLCYSCIETYPAQSEIKISFNLNGQHYERVLDISVNEQRMLTFVAMHD